MEEYFCDSRGKLVPRVLVICSTKRGGAHWMSSIIANCLSQSISSEAILLSPSSRDQSIFWRVAINIEVYLLEKISKVLRRILTKNDFYFFNFGLNSITATLWLMLNRHKFDTILVLWRSYFVGSMSLRLLSRLGKKVVVYHTDHAALTGGCHFQNGCVNASSGCKNCPAISSIFQFIPALNYKNLKNLSRVATSISPNRNFANQIKRSGVEFYQEYIQYFPVSELYYVKKITVRPRNRLVFVSSKIDDVRKGLNLLVRSFTKYQIELRKFDLTLCFVGKGSLASSKLKDLTEFYQVECYESLSPSDLASLYAKSFAIINVPQQDMGPSTVFEALCSGLLVVSSDVGIAPELIEECDAGAVMTSYDEDSLFLSVKEILQISDESYRKKLQGVEDFVSVFKTSDFAKRLIECL